MGGGLTFLSKKSFNPSNNINQKSVWEAEQIKDREKARVRDRERQLRIERDHEELARARDGARGADRATMTFMYDLPPGANSKKLRDGSSSLDNDDISVGNSQTDGIPSGTGGGNGGDSGKGPLLQRKAGDDDAAAAFRLILARGYNNSAESSSLVEEGESGMKGGSCVMTGSTAENTSTRDMSRLTQLEKAVGRKDTGGILSYDEQIARFPQLKNAPMALKRKGVDQFGDASAETANLNVNFKPLGAQIRNVRCLKCGVWGHSRGDRECQFGWDPFSTKVCTATPLESAKPVGLRQNDSEDSNRPLNSNDISERKRKDIAPSDEDISRNRGSSDDDSTNERTRIRKKRKKRKRDRENNRRRKDKKRKRRVERKDEEDSVSYDDDSCSYESLEYERRSKRKGRSHSKSYRHERRTDRR